MLSVKQQLYDYCKKYLATRIEEAQQNIADVQEASVNETKSSAGDKYETSREMMQQEINRERSRLYELQKLKASLDVISPLQENVLVQTGSIVYTDLGNYYIAVSLGAVENNGIIFQTISLASPIGSRLSGLKKGDSFIFNNKAIRILKVA